MEPTPDLQARIEDLLGEVSGEKGQKAAVALLKALGTEVFDPMAMDATGVPWSVRMVGEGKLDVVKALYPAYGKALLQGRGKDGQGVLDAGWAVVLEEMTKRRGGYNDVGMGTSLKDFAWLLHEVPQDALAPRGYEGADPASEWLGRIVARCGRLGSSSQIEGAVDEALRRGADADMAWEGRPLGLHIGHAETLERLLAKGLDLAKGGYDPAQPDTPGHVVLYQRHELQHTIAKWRAAQPVAKPGAASKAVQAPKPPPAPASASSSIHSVNKGYLGGEWEHRAWRNIPVLWLALGRNAAVLDLLDPQRVGEALQWRGPGNISPWVFAIERMEGWWTSGNVAGEDRNGHKENALRTLHAQMQAVPVAGGPQGLVGSIIAGLVPGVGEDPDDYSYRYHGEGALRALRRVKAGKPEGRDPYFGRDRRYWADLPALPWSEFWGTREEQDLLGGRLLGLLSRSIGEAPDGSRTSSMNLAGLALNLWLDTEPEVRNGLHPRLNGAMQAIYHARRAAKLIEQYKNARSEHSGLHAYGGNQRKDERLREQARARYLDGMTKIAKTPAFPVDAPCSIEEADRAAVDFVRGQQLRQIEVIITSVQAGGSGTLGLGKALAEKTLEAGMLCRGGWAAMALAPATPEAGRRRRLA